MIDRWFLFWKWLTFSCFPRTTSLTCPMQAWQLNQMKQFLSVFFYVIKVTSPQHYFPPPHCMPASGQLSIWAASCLLIFWYRCVHCSAAMFVFSLARQEEMSLLSQPSHGQTHLVWHFVSFRSKTTALFQAAKIADSQGKDSSVLFLIWSGTDEWCWRDEWVEEYSGHRMRNDKWTNGEVSSRAEWQLE